MKKLLLKISTGLTIFAAQTTTFAAYGVDETIVANGSSSGGFKESFMGVLNYFLGFLGIIAMVMIIKEGLSMITGGEEEREKAQKNIIALIIGLVIIGLSYSIVKLATDI